jgi:hypothetical protein
MVKIGPYFHVHMSCNFCLFFNFFVPKTYVLKFILGVLFIWTLWAVLLGLPNRKMTLTSFNVSVDVDL